MSDLTTRASKGSALTHNELDANFAKVAQTKAAPYTVLVTDNRDTIEYSGTGAESFTMPDTSTVVAAADTGDFEVTIKHKGTGVLTVTCITGIDTIDGSTSDFTLDPNDVITLKAVQAGTGYSIVTGATLNGVTRTNTATLANKTLLSPTLITPALGTPASGVMTNVTGTAAGLTAGTATTATTVITNANLTGDITSVGNAAAIAAGVIDYADLNTWYSTLGAVGTYAFLGDTSATSTAAGATIAGSNLRYSGFSANSWANLTPSPLGALGSTGTPAGTWRAMGTAVYTTGNFAATLWLRIS